jgi:hypothetical protein
VAVLIDPAGKHRFEDEDFLPATGQLLFLDLPRYSAGNSFRFPPVSDASASEIGRAALLVPEADLRRVDFVGFALPFAFEDADARHFSFSAIHLLMAPHLNRFARPWPTCGMFSDLK